MRQNLQRRFTRAIEGRERCGSSADGFASAISQRREGVTKKVAISHDFKFSWHLVIYSEEECANR
jgi:hypothetical protein